jgi:NADH-quinone oxidoreductase subunit M
MLSTLLLLPLIGALIVALLPTRDPMLIRRATLAATGMVLLFAWTLLGQFDPAVASIQFYETHAWHARLGSSFSLGVDGFSLPLILLAALLMVVAVIASSAVKNGARMYFSLLLVLETAMFGVFMARDWTLFYVFWELTLIPLFFLIDRMGGSNRERRQKAALNFVIYTMGGSVFMLISLLLLYDASPTHSFGMAALADAARSLPIATQVWIFAGLFIGFGVKMAVFPLHGWVPLVYSEAPAAVPLISSGILLKMGGYGLLRATETLPGAAWALQGWLAVLAFITIIYAGVLAWRQRDLVLMLAYASISHMGVVLLGLAALNTAGLTGAVMQMVAHGLVAGALFLLVGLLHQRTHTRDIGEYSSLVRSMPRFAFFMVLALVAAVGLPGTAGFIAELHALVGGFARWGGWMLLLSLSLLVSAAYAFRTVGRLFTGPVAPVGTAMQSVPDLTRSEMAAAGLLATGILGIGFYPAPALALIGSSVARLARLFGG